MPSGKNCHRRRLRPLLIIFVAAAQFILPSLCGNVGQKIGAVDENKELKNAAGDADNFSQKSNAKTNSSASMSLDEVEHKTDETNANPIDKLKFDQKQEEVEKSNNDQRLITADQQEKIGNDKSKTDQQQEEGKKSSDQQLDTDQRHEEEEEEEEEELIFERRQKECCGQLLYDERYRLISYNILANLYLRLGWVEQQPHPFFPYCPARFLEATYRWPLLLRELDGYNADLMALQEVDVQMEQQFLTPFLLSKNYSSVFNRKGNGMSEGLLIAFRNDRFYRLADEEGNNNFTVKLSDVLEEDPANLDIRTYLAQRHKLRAIVSSRPTILQLIRLRAKHDGREVLCANTHLYFNPAHDEVKIIQTLLCLRHIANVRSRLSSGSADGAQPIQVIFSGDFNSTPDSRAVALIAGSLIRLGMAEDGVHYGTGANFADSSIWIRAPFNSKRLSGTSDYTNFTRPPGAEKGFNGCLDYIWAHPPVRVDRIWPMPDHRLVTKYGALPSQIAPSDHLPILCDVRMWRSNNNSAIASRNTSIGWTNRNGNNTISNVTISSIGTTTASTNGTSSKSSGTINNSGIISNGTTHRGVTASTNGTNSISNGTINNSGITSNGTIHRGVTASYNVTNSKSNGTTYRDVTVSTNGTNSKSNGTINNSGITSNGTIHKGVTASYNVTNSKSNGTTYRDVTVSINGINSKSNGTINNSGITNSSEGREKKQQSKRMRKRERESRRRTMVENSNKMQSAAAAERTL